MRQWLICLLVTLALVGCRSTPSVSPSPVATRPQVETPSVAATGTAGPAPTLVVPTPSADTGVVTGQINVRASNSPLAGPMVYLGDAVPLEPGPGYLITFKEKESPHVMTDAAGRFALAGKPGSYAIIVWTPFASRVVADPADPSVELTIDLPAGKLVDLGSIVIDWP